MHIDNGSLGMKPNPSNFKAAYPVFAQLACVGATLPPGKLLFSGIDVALFYGLRHCNCTVSCSKIEKFQLVDLLS